LGMGGMGVGCARITGLIVAGVVASSVAALAQLTYDGMAGSMPGQRDSGPVVSPRRDLLANALGANNRPSVQQRTTHHTKVDLGPIVDQITAYLNQHGVPIHQDEELSGDDGIVFSAAFRLSETLPDMQFHIGDRGPFDAFYGDGGGFRLSLSWPVFAARHIALHLEGGDNGAFGNWGVIGLQWHHPTRPVVVGVGMPVALDDANGPVGVIWQIRMVLP